jgi:prepilin-type N-terminal cleavage/methylation domain-containing protein
MGQVPYFCALRINPPYDGAMQQKQGSRRRGITLVEVLIVVGILGLLTAIALPVILRGKENAKQTGCLARLHQIGKTTILYQGDHDGLLPSANPRSGLAGGVRPTRDPLKTYGLQAIDYQCPSRIDKGHFNHPEVSDYLFRFIIDFSELNNNYTLPYRLEPHPTSVLAWDWHHGVVTDLNEAIAWFFLRADGSVSRAVPKAMRKSYLVNKAWTFTEPPVRNSYYQFVFPNEEWPPGLTALD